MDSKLQSSAFSSLENEKVVVSLPEGRRALIEAMVKMKRQT